MEEADFWREMLERAGESETDSEVEEDKVEDYLNRCESPHQRTSKYWTLEYQKRRDARKEAQEARRIAHRNFKRHALSPPATPPHTQNQQQLQNANQDVPLLHLNGSEIQKGTNRSCKAPRYPTTRSRGADMVALLPEKGMVRCWLWWIRWNYVDMSYNTYLRDFNSEKLLAEYPEEAKLGANWMTPTSQKHADFQRKVQARKKRQKETLKDKVGIPKEPNGFICNWHPPLLNTEIIEPVNSGKTLTSMPLALQFHTLSPLFYQPRHLAKIPSAQCSAPHTRNANRLTILQEHPPHSASRPIYNMPLASELPLGQADDAAVILVQVCETPYEQAKESVHPL